MATRCNRAAAGEYISFISDNGKWKINDGYDHISKVYENYKEGKLILSPKRSQETFSSEGKYFYNE